MSDAPPSPRAAPDDAAGRLLVDFTIFQLVIVVFVVLVVYCFSELVRLLASSVFGRSVFVVGIRGIVF